MNDCLYKVKIKGTKRKVKVYGVHGQYFLIWDAISNEFIFDSTKKYEPILDKEESY